MWGVYGPGAVGVCGSALGVRVCAAAQEGMGYTCPRGRCRRCRCRTVTRGAPAGPVPEGDGGRERRGRPGRQHGPRPDRAGGQRDGHHALEPDAGHAAQTRLHVAPAAAQLTAGGPEPGPAPGDTRHLPGLSQTLRCFLLPKRWGTERPLGRSPVPGSASHAPGAANGPFTRTRTSAHLPKPRPGRLPSIPHAIGAALERDPEAVGEGDFLVFGQTEGNGEGVDKVPAQRGFARRVCCFCWVSEGFWCHAPWLKCFQREWRKGEITAEKSTVITRGFSSVSKR